MALATCKRSGCSNGLPFWPQLFLAPHWLLLALPGSTFISYLQATPPGLPQPLLTSAGSSWLLLAHYSPPSPLFLAPSGPPSFSWLIVLSTSRSSLPGEADKNQEPQGAAVSLVRRGWSPRRLFRSPNLFGSIMGPSGPWGPRALGLLELVETYADLYSPYTDLYDLMKPYAL